MSCNGCRVLRRGCSEHCIIRPCLQWIDTPQAQGHATVFLAKFFGRAALMSFISAVPLPQRPALFQSLLFEACGRTVNPVNGAVGLLGTGNWHVCQAAVQTVLRGGTLRPIPDFLGGGCCGAQTPPDVEEASEAEVTCMLDQVQVPNPDWQSKEHERTCTRGVDESSRGHHHQFPDLRLRLKPCSEGAVNLKSSSSGKKQRPPSVNYSEEESVTTNCAETSGFGFGVHHAEGREGAELLNLFLN